MRELREDLRLIYDWIAPNSKVLDLGCGDGQLLAALVEEKNCIGYGVELDTDNSDCGDGFGRERDSIRFGKRRHGFTDNSFDVVVLSQTIQAMKNTEIILQEMKRVARLYKPS